MSNGKRIFFLDRSALGMDLDRRTGINLERTRVYLGQIWTGEQEKKSIDTKEKWSWIGDKKNGGKIGLEWKEEYQEKRPNRPLKGFWMRKCRQNQRFHAIAATCSCSLPHGREVKSQVLHVISCHCCHVPMLPTTCPCSLPHVATHPLLRATWPKTPKMVNIIYNTYFHKYYFKKIMFQSYHSLLCLFMNIWIWTPSMSNCALSDET